jgi:hypothetical protein
MVEEDPEVEATMEEDPEAMEGVMMEVNPEVKVEQEDPELKVTMVEQDPELKVTTVAEGPEVMVGVKENKITCKRMNKS